MQIDRSNYEIWLIDWLDGNLSDIQIEQLQLFLRDNHDLKEEFEELTTFRLNPSEKSFPHKSRLQKSPSDLSETQFEYLSVAYLENDISADQQAELKESIQNDTERKTIFELIQKMSLSPVPLLYKHRNRLFRRTVFQNVIRLTVIGLSAAAIITLVVINYISKPKTLQVRFEKTAQPIVPDSVIQKPPVIVPDKIKTESKVLHSQIESKNLTARSAKTSSVISEVSLTPHAENDSLFSPSEPPPTLINKISVSPLIDLKGKPIPGTLIALKTSTPVAQYDDGRSKLNKFIAKTFREKILKEKSAKDSPLKGYELAEAGVSGLNKLLDCEMVLDEKRDANGELKSVYFSSKIIKFNAPVKKSEPLP